MNANVLLKENTEEAAQHLYVFIENRAALLATLFHKCVVWTCPAKWANSLEAATAKLHWPQAIL